MEIRSPDSGPGSRIATQLPISSERELEAVRLAAIGVAMNGLAHESRNAMQRSQVCLEMLAREVRDRPAAQNLIARIQLAQNDLQRLYEKVLDYASPLRLDPQRQSLASIVRDAWLELEPLRSGRAATLREEFLDSDLACEVDRRTMTQLFCHLLKNAFSICLDPVDIAIRYDAVEFAAQPALQIVVADNGPGFSAADRENAFAPFFTTRTKGTGLGLAASRRIAEAHGGRITLGAGSAAGAQLILILPRRTT